MISYSCHSESSDRACISFDQIYIYCDIGCRGLHIFLFFYRDYVCLSCPEMLEFQGVHAWIRDTSVIFGGFCFPAIRLHDVRCVATQCTVLVQCHILGLDFRMQCDVACSVMCHLVQCLSGSLPLQFLCRPWVRPIVPNLLASSSVL